MYKLNENFSNILDSSVVDYSSFAEKTDKKARIEKWMNENTVNTIDYTGPAKYRLDEDFNIYVDVPYYDDPQWKSLTQYGGCLIRNRKYMNTNEEGAHPVGNLPDYINFKLCIGYFDCQGQEMTTLRGCPERIEGNGINGTFWCRHNKLKNLVGGPKYVEGEYNCCFNPLESLEGIPEQCDSYNIDEKYVVPSDMKEELHKRVYTPSMKETYETFLKRKDYVSIKQFGYDNMYWTKNIKINENFSNILDSSVVDYSSEFEKNDIKRLTTKFKEDVEDKIEDLFDTLGHHKVFHSPVDYDIFIEDIESLEVSIRTKYKDEWFPEYEKILSSLLSKAYDDANNIEIDSEYDPIESEYYDQYGNWDPIDDEDLDDINENFSNILDSSVVDYTKHFENEDLERKKKQVIINWLRYYTSIYIPVTGENLDSEIDDGNGIKLLKFVNANTREEHYEIDVFGDLEFTSAGIERLPDYIIFHECKGDFNANGVTFKTLKNFPSVINKDFYIRDSAIRSFKDGPEVVGGDLYCTNNPQLKGIKALQGFPKVYGDIYCDKNLEKYIYSTDDSGWDM